MALGNRQSSKWWGYCLFTSPLELCEMRTRVFVLVVLAWIACPPMQGDAAPFVNLDFEQSTVLPSDPVIVPTSAAFPGWTAWIGNVPQDFVYHDAQGAGDPVVALYDHDIAF